MANEFYVGIKSPKQVRKDLLLGSKNVLEVLKKSQDIMLLRKEKLFIMDVLSQEIAELQLLLERLSDHLPEDLLDNSPVKPVINRSLPKKNHHKLPGIDLSVPEIDSEIKSVVDSEVSNSVSELQKIEAALANVESKLKYLD